MLEHKKPIAPHGRRNVVIAVVLILAVGVGFAIYKMARKEPGVKRIGILQLVSHPSLDHIREGIIREMRSHQDEMGVEFTFDVQNAQGDMKVVKTISDKFAAGNYDLLIPITTPAAQAVANAEKDAPVVFGAVTDPVVAGVVKSIEEPGGNVTGVSDLWPIRKQIELALKLVPNAKTIGTIYNPGEANSQTIIKLIRQACAANGLKLKEATVAQGSEVLIAARSMVGQVDLIFTAADSTVGAAYESVVKVARENKIPIFAGDGDSVKRGAIGTLGIDYANVGRLTGQLAVKILKGASPSKTPVVLVTDTKPIFNLSAANTFGVRIPEELKRGAEFVDQSSD